MKTPSENSPAPLSDARPRSEAVESSESPAAPTEPPTSAWSALCDFLLQVYCWTLIAFILYVLSIGPVYSSWREAVELGKRPLLQALYMPLAALCSRFESLNTVVEWYIELWQ